MLKGYKGFSKGLVCRGKQYAENEIFEEPNASACNCGMHFCDNPLAVLGYYPPKDGNEFAEVESLAEKEDTDDSQKFATTKLRVGLKIGLPALIKAGLKFIFEKVERAKDKIETSDDSSTAASSGYRSTAASSGYSSTAASSGDRSTAASSGDRSTARVSGKNSIAVANGSNAAASGAIGCYIALTEYGDNGKILCAKMTKVDGKRIKADTLYTLKNGKFVKI